ncbi:MAG TPA: MFS transporter, partial [Rudaea sp.]|nr:MFS transporter [Rudaea sp.]
AMVGLGIVLMGPNTYLPTFGQSVLGLGAIEAGLLLATISLGWPLASSWSGRLYLRIGFRDTALIGAALALLATAAFVLLPEPASLPVLVLVHAFLGAGFGLMSTPILVALQSAVSWGERGVVTGANMFSRYLGMSLGAVLVGAIFNHGMRDALQDAPTPGTGGMSGNMDAVIRAVHDPSTPHAVAEFLRQAMTSATVHVYLGVAVAALLTVLAIAGIRRDFAMHGERKDDVMTTTTADGPH